MERSLREAAGRVAASLKDTDDVSLEPIVSAAEATADRAAKRAEASDTPAAAREVNNRRAEDLLHAAADGAVRGAKAAESSPGDGGSASAPSAGAFGPNTAASGADGADAAMGVGPWLASRIRPGSYAGVPPEQHATDARALAAQAPAERWRL